MAVVRSPNYPAITLADAISRVDTLYRKEHKHPTPREVLAKDLGYGSWNGASSAVISALSKYGLLEAANKEGVFRVSEDAIDILLHHPGEPDRRRAIEKAAFKPALFSELYSVFGKSLPSDHNLRTFLLKKDFNQNTVDGVIRIYRDTIEFVNVETEDSNTESVEEMQEVPMQTQAMKQAGPVQASPINDVRSAIPMASQVEKDLGESVVGFKLTSECGARIEFLGQVTQEAIDKLIKHLELSKDAYPAKAVLEQRLENHEIE
jgi:hypothetical protein